MILKNIFLSLGIAVSLGLVSPGLADTWTVDQENSQLGFEVQQGSSKLTGLFGSWKASIDFDPAAPETAKISAEINPATATTGNAQFDGTLPNQDWFDVSAFPAATFQSNTVTLVEGNSYRADGTLTIKGMEQPVELDFTLEITGDTAKATGTATVNRLSYGLGAGVGTDTVGDIVSVTLDLTATR